MRTNQNNIVKVNVYHIISLKLIHRTVFKQIINLFRISCARDRQLCSQKQNEKKLDEYIQLIW